MWNDVIKQNIINELNEQFNCDSSFSTIENHSYSDSIFSPLTTNMYKPIRIDNVLIPNYYETTISRTRAIREIPVHTLAFSDSFEGNSPPMSFAEKNVSMAYTNTNVNVSDEEHVYDMDQILNSSNAITFSISPEQRGVAIAKKVTWKEIWFEDVSLIKNTNFAAAIKKFCSIKI